MNILVINLGAAGDVIRSTAILPGLKEKYPKAKIDWVTRSPYRELIQGNPYIRSIYLIDKDKEKLLSNSYDLIINTDEDFEACHLATNIRHNHLVGAFLHGKKAAYTPNSAIWFDKGLISRHGLRKANILIKNNDKTYQNLWYTILGITYRKQRPHMPLIKENIVFAKKFAQKNGINGKDYVIGFNPGSSKRWWDKRMSLGDTTKLGWGIIDKNPKAKVILLGGPEETDRNGLIKKRLPFLIDSGVKNSLGQFAGIINLCNTVIASDSLAMHMAVALKKKVIAFFAPTSYKVIELYDNNHKVLPVRGCVGCYRKECRIKPIYDIDEMVKLI
ncbi:MAG: glycosyltransferase family 9 protein [Parcubacteria group bacterium]|nr:glycosyltransferase family 9 protein [Parcubacteria group bacterium]